MVPFTNHYNAIYIDRLPSKTKIGKGPWCFNNSPPQKSRFKENAKILSKSSTSQENVTISRQNLLFFLKIQKITTQQQVTDGKTPNLVLKRILELFLKIPLFKKISEFQD